jgi:hypothetical protein
MKNHRAVAYLGLHIKSTVHVDSVSGLLLRHEEMPEMYEKREIRLG